MVTLLRRSALGDVVLLGAVTAALGDARVVTSPRYVPLVRRLIGVREAVAWTLGSPCLTVHGGVNRWTGRRSVIEIAPIIAARGHARARVPEPTPALTNAALFARDQWLCLYCGADGHRLALTRDHVVPTSKGGRDVWENVVAACIHCNSKKGGRTPQQAGMPLLAVPFRPSWVEHLILSNRHILADQMAFLTAHLPKRARPQG